MSKQVKSVVDGKTVIAKLVEAIYANVQKALDGLAIAKNCRLENVKMLNTIHPDWEKVRTFNPEKAQGTEMEIIINNIRLGVQAIGVSGVTGKDAANNNDEWYQIKLAKRKLLAQAQALPEENKAGEKETRAKKALKAEDFRFGCEGMLAHMTYCAVHPEAVQSSADTDAELNDLLRRTLTRLKVLNVDLPPRARKAK